MQLGKLETAAIPRLRLCSRPPATGVERCWSGDFHMSGLRNTLVRGGGESVCLVLGARIPYFAKYILQDGFHRDTGRRAYRVGTGHLERE